MIMQTTSLHWQNNLNKEGAATMIMNDGANNRTTPDEPPERSWWTKVPLSCASLRACTKFVLLLNVVEDLIVWEDFLILIIIYWTTEHEPSSIAVKLGILLLDGLDNACAKPLTIFLWIKKEGASNKVCGVEHRELRWLGLLFMVGDGDVLATRVKWHLGDRIMPQLHNGRWLPTKRINSQVLLSRLNSRVDGRIEEDLL